MTKRAKAVTTQERPPDDDAARLRAEVTELRARLESERQARSRVVAVLEALRDIKSLASDSEPALRQSLEELREMPARLEHFVRGLTDAKASDAVGHVGKLVQVARRRVTQRMLDNEGEAHTIAHLKYVAAEQSLRPKDLEVA